MTDKVEATSKPNLKHPTRFTYDVGYSKPPRDSWFAAGTSGNPSGRPKGSKNKPPRLKDKNISEVLRDELFRKVQLNGNRIGTGSALQAVTRKLFDWAMEGNIRAALWVMAAGHAVEAADTAQQEADYRYAVEYKERWEDPMKLMYDSFDRPQPIPNPAHVILDDRNRRVMFAGPRNEEEMTKHLAGEDFKEGIIEEEAANEEQDEDDRNCIDEVDVPEMRVGPSSCPSDGSLEDERLRN
jgi:hypothetical protein